MNTNQTFWLLLHDIAAAINSDGATCKDQAEILAGYLYLYPPASRGQLIKEFSFVLGVLSELEPAVAIKVGAKLGKLSSAPPSSRRTRNRREDLQ